MTDFTVQSQTQDTSSLLLIFLTLQRFRSDLRADDECRCRECRKRRQVLRTKVSIVNRITEYLKKELVKLETSIEAAQELFALENNSGDAASPQSEAETVEVLKSEAGEVEIQNSEAGEVEIEQSDAGALGVVEK